MVAGQLAENAVAASERAEKREKEQAAAVRFLPLSSSLDLSHLTFVSWSNCHA